MNKIIEKVLNILDPAFPSELEGKEPSVSISSTDSEDTEEELELEEEEEEEEVVIVVPKSTALIKSYSTDFALPEVDQCIVRVTKVINRYKVRITTDNVQKYSISVPKRLLDLIHVKNYLLIQPPADGSENIAEIIRVIDGDYKRFYEANNVWPIHFDDPDLGILGPLPPKQKQKSKKKDKKKDSKSDLKAPIIEATGKKPAKSRKKRVKRDKNIFDTEEEEEEKLESVSESDSDDNAKTRMDKRRRRLALIGTHAEKENVDNTTVTSAVVTSREPIVKHRDEMPIILGNRQPWSAVLHHKPMTEKQKKKHIQKEMKKMRKRIGKRALTDEKDLPCGAVKGQIMVPWETIAGKYTNKKQQLDDTV